MNHDFSTEATPLESSDRAFDRLVQEACEVTIRGWDFTWIRARTTSPGPSWSYPDLAGNLMAPANSLLDLDTGGGEQLAALSPLPRFTVATEAWAPNVPIARQRLADLGIEVREQHGDRIPANDGEFDLVLNRHGSLAAAETHRVLAPGGVLMTQQVGSRNDLELNDALAAPSASTPDSDTLDTAVTALTRHGFDIIDTREEYPEFIFYDIGAVIYQLRAVPWQIPDFDVCRYYVQLRQLHEYIRLNGSFTAHDHRYLIHAIKPISPESR